VYDCVEGGTGVLEYLGGKGLARRYRVRRPRRGGKMSVGSRRALSQLLCEIVRQLECGLNDAPGAGRVCEETKPFAPGRKV